MKEESEKDLKRALELFRKGQNTRVTLHPRCGEWITAREARELFITKARATPSEAERALLTRALFYWPCKAESWRRTEDPVEGIERKDFFKRRDVDLSHFSERPTVHAWSEAISFFEAIAEHEPILAPNGVRYASWSTGDFCVQLEREFSDVTLDVRGLSFDSKCVLSAVGISYDSRRSEKRISERELRKWIADCKTENSKTAWKMLRSEFGNRAPKKADVFEPIWRELKGFRGRGRPKKSAE